MTASAATRAHDEPPIRAVRRRLTNGIAQTEILLDSAWQPYQAGVSAPAPLGLPAVPAWRDGEAGPGGALLPFAPVSFRDFMLYEQHVIDASRGMARRYLPQAFRVADAFERLTRRTFPKFKPSALWYAQPIYYMSNALTIAPTGTDVAVPSYANELDYELELGFVINKPLRNATPDEAAAAIAGYVVLNDFSVRSVQLPEMRSGFGPQKSKHFATSISQVLVSAADVPLARIEAGLTAEVAVNGVPVAKSTTSGMQHTLGEALAHASRDEQLYPGELFGSGTLPGCCGVENGRLLTPGDELTMSIEGIGTIAHHISAN